MGVGIDPEARVTDVAVYAASQETQDVNSLVKPTVKD